MAKKSVHPGVWAHVVVLQSVGLNQVQTSKQLTISRCWVQNSIKIYKQLGRYDDFQHTERPNNLSDPEVRHLKSLSKGDARLSQSKIASDLNTSIPKSVIKGTKEFERSWL